MEDKNANFLNENNGNEQENENKYNISFPKKTNIYIKEKKKKILKKFIKKGYMIKTMK